MGQLKIKICGMREKENIAQVIRLNPDFIGFIFYKKSKRYVGDTSDLSFIEQVPEKIKRVGVFVNEPIEKLLAKVNRYKLDFIQLHGDEPPEYLKELKLMGISTIKAFRLDQDFIFDNLHKYTSVCNYFMFDTKSDQYGGSGKKFDWDLLSQYKEDNPVFLSGGIGPEDIQKIKNLQMTNLFAVDINSRFEIEPGIKSIVKIEHFINEIKN
ncbi:MAG: phosphoribosylanthranilate isomerase [Bacteroidales bacterium]|nr:phosphoribosylanthranilate isomerase [Bacteroidales bacterium]